MTNFETRCDRRALLTLAAVSWGLLTGCTPKPAVCPECQAYLGIVSTLENTCLSGQSAAVSAKVTGALDVFKKAANGDASVSEETIRGARKDWDSAVARDENQDIRECLKPVQEKLLACVDRCVASKQAGGPPAPAPPADAKRQIAINLHRVGANDCPTLPTSAQIDVVSAKGDSLSVVNITSGCKASFSLDEPSTGRVTLKMSDGNPFELASPQASYSLEAASWDGYVTDTRGTHLVVSLFSYVGQCHDLSEAYSTFENILRSKAQSLRGLFANADRRYDYLNSVSVVPTGLPMNMSTDEIHAYWRDNGSLQIMSGLCVNKAQGEFMRSSIFSGPLAGSLPEPLVIDLKVNENEFGTTRDIYSASMLFALAQEAQARKLDTDVIISYLGRAREIATEVPNQGGHFLLAAIDNSLRVAGAPSGLAN